MNPLLVSWEAEYSDGTTYAERNGGLYKDIDRDRLVVFRLVAPGEILTELRTRDGITGHQLAYRRRTIFVQGVKSIWFLLGWVPGGPVVAINPETMSYQKSYWFNKGSGPLGMVSPLPFERWNPHAFHRTDLYVRDLARG